MASKATNTADVSETPDEPLDGPLLDTLGVAVKKMVARGKERGYITYDELNAALPPDEVSSEQIEDTMAMLSEMGINLVESEEGEEAAAPDEEFVADGEAVTAGNVDEEDLGRTDDPVRMYLREMGSVELLSREGEIAIAKRIEAGREMMIGGICESPMTIRAVLEWHDALVENKMLLRDIIDLDATYGSPTLTFRKRNSKPVLPRWRWPVPNRPPSSKGRERRRKEKRCRLETRPRRPATRARAKARRAASRLRPWKRR